MHDEANIGVQMVTASTVNAIELTDQNGDAITAERQLYISQSGSIVAVGSYDYRLNDGLQLTMALRALNYSLNRH